MFGAIEEMQDIIFSSFSFLEIAEEAAKNIDDWNEWLLEVKEFFKGLGYDWL